MCDCLYFVYNYSNYVIMMAVTLTNSYFHVFWSPISWTGSWDLWYSRWHTAAAGCSSVAGHQHSHMLRAVSTYRSRGSDPQPWSCDPLSPIFIHTPYSLIEITRMNNIAINKMHNACISEGFISVKYRPLPQSSVLFMSIGRHRF